MRQRLSWDEDKVAELNKQADPYSMNQEHKNPPVEKYRTGDPSAWAEDPHMATPWKNEGRTETGHPAPARQAVAAARKLEDKAIKCITVAQRMLPGASDEVIEEQATDLMYMPENAVMSTLTRQASLAESMVSAGDDEDDEDEKEEKAAAKKEEDYEDEDKKGKAAGDDEDDDEEEEDKSAGKDMKKEEEEEEDKSAKKEEKMEEEEEDKSAGKDMKKEEEEEEDKSAKKEEKMEEEEEDKSAGKEEKMEEEEEGSKKEADLLDVLFDTAEASSEPETKTGAKKLSGMVRKASSGSSDLTGIWDTPPDVSKVFRS